RRRCAASCAASSTPRRASSATRARRGSASPTSGTSCRASQVTMRIATWNVNSLKVRLEKLAWWIERARPDVILLQETKLADDAARRDELARLGYDLAHHGQGRWNGVAIASRVGIAEVVTSFGHPIGTAASDEGDADPLAEARMLSAMCGGVRVVSLYAPNGR